MLTTPMVARFHSSAASSSATETLKLRAQPVFQAAHNLAPIFDRLCRFDVEFEGEKSDGHSVSSFQLLSFQFRVTRIPSRNRNHSKPETGNSKLLMPLLPRQSAR